MGQKGRVHRSTRRALAERAHQQAAAGIVDQVAERVAREVVAELDGGQAPAPATMLDELGKIPLYTYVSAQPGPQGGRDMWVSVQLNHGLMALAFAFHPATVEQWLRETGRDMRAMANQLKHHNSGLTVVSAGEAMPKRELWVPGKR